jgi:hypothetical protein
MLCRRCKEMFWDLKAARKGDEGEISYHYSARSPNFELRQRCNACKLFYGSNRGLGRIKTKIIWMKTTRIDYALIFDVHDSKDLQSRLGATHFQITRIGPRHGTGTLNAITRFF